MRAVVQRVTRASVTVDGEVVGRIGPGLCVLVVTHTDEEDTARRLASRIARLRVFAGADGRMDRSVDEMGAGHGVLVVSQFTLYGDTRKGRRPSYVDVAAPEQAEPLFDVVVEQLRGLGAMVATGRFRTHMRVALTNDGPVTLLLEV